MYLPVINNKKGLFRLTDGYNYTNSVELFDLDTQTWKRGPSLPFGLGGPSLLEYDNGLGALLVGGYKNKSDPNDSAYSDKIFQFEFYRTFWSSIFYPNTYYGRWKERQERLDYATADFPAFWVFNDWC